MLNTFLYIFDSWLLRNILEIVRGHADLLFDSSNLLKQTGV